MKRPTPAVSIVVPTRNRPDDLKRCLIALSGQSGLASFEILVVDDGGDDADAIRAFVSARSRARLVRQDFAGPATARNAGVRAALGEVVCFTDDDCEPDPEWAERLQSALVAGADAAGGGTMSGRPGDPFVEAMDAIIRQLQWPNCNSGRTEFAPTNNLASSRKLLLELAFDESYGAASGEDRDWCARLLTAGGTIVVVPDAVVRHFPPPGFVPFWRQHVRYGRGAYRLSRRRKPKPGIQRPSFYVRLVLGGFSGGLRCGALVIVAQIATAIGFVAEARAMKKRGLPAGSRANPRLLARAGRLRAADRDGQPTEHEQLLRRAYAAFNARDIEAALSLMHSDVDWPNAMEGRRENGQAAVRDYWTRQFQLIDAHVEPKRFEMDDEGRVVVDVHQLVRDTGGNVLSAKRVRHVYTLRDGLIERMDVRDDP